MFLIVFFSDSYSFPFVSSAFLFPGLGFFLSLMEHFSPFIYSYKLVLFFSVGFVGSLSTFSSFVYDLFDLCLQLKFSRAFKLLTISLILGIIALKLGFVLGNQ